jgi:hypothetical protein
MPDDFDHEVIDSPQALLRHLYQAHGVQEARDVNPDTAPLQFWVRRHAELERAGATPRERPAAPPAPAPTPTRPAAGEPRPPAAGPRYRPFADPLVEAAVTALVRRGLEERQVRRWIASHGGEEAVRATLLDPVVEALAARMRGGEEGPPQSRQTPAAPTGAPTPPAPSPAGPLDADFMAIADVLQSRRRRGGRGQREPSPRPPARADDHDDYMAVANAVQRGRDRG